MSVDVEIPQPFETGVELSGAVDLDLDNIHVSVDALPPVNAALTTTNQLNTENQLTLKSTSDLKATLGTDVDANLKSENQVDIKSQSQLTTESQLKTENKVAVNSESQVDVGLDNVRIRELPEIKFRAGLMPMKLAFPLSFKLRFNLFGFEIFKIETSGESKILVEP